jgi:hypothetical protein
MLILSLDGDVNGQYNTALCPSIASKFVVGTENQIGNNNGISVNHFPRF